MHRPIAIAALAGVFGVAVLTLVKQAELNGTLPKDNVFSYSSRVLHGTSIPMTIPQTGITKVDNFFAFMMDFFWMALDEKNTAAHLQASYIIGTLSASFLLMLSEAHRSSSTVGFMLGTYFFELMGEMLGIGIFTPAWCIFHLISTRAPSKDKHDSNGVNSIAAPPGTMHALGYSLLVGHVAPTLFMKNLDVADLGWKSAQLWTILRLFHPVFVLLAFAAFKPVQSTTGAASQTAIRRVSSKRKIYIFAILASASGHIATLGVVPALREVPAWIIPNIAAITDGKQVDLATGVARFLQWDNICAASAIFVWAGSLYLESLSVSPTAADFQALFDVVLQVAGLTLLAGPAAGAAFFLMERDDVLVEYYQSPLIRKVK
jgi:hypothetical protein